MTCAGRARALGLLGSLIGATLAAAELVDHDRGVCLPQVQTAALLSPRSQYQAVAQELARIRSRRQLTKRTSIFYYENTTETAKARRLAEHLSRDNRYRGNALFEVTDIPAADAIPERELAHLVNEEAIALGKGARSARLAREAVCLASGV